jgi:N-acetylglutamate synthase
MTDVLGILIAWTEADVTVRRDDETDITIPQAEIVAAKPVPPRPERRRRSQGTP